MTLKFQEYSDLRELGPRGGLFRAVDADSLVVLLHAYDSSPARLQNVALEVRELRPNSDIFVPRLPVSLFSLSDPEQIATDLIEAIDELYAKSVGQDGGGYFDIVFVGHSLGAMMARKVWALAYGVTPEAKIDETSALHHPWREKVSRIVLLAALNRGWRISSTLGPLMRLAATLGTAWGNFCRYFLRRDPLAFGFRRGAAFLTGLRLQVLAVAASQRRSEKAMPITVQLIGTEDDFVAPTDNVDLATGQDFFYLSVTGSTHEGIVELDEGADPTGPSAMFRVALVGAAAKLETLALKKADIFELYDESTDDFDAIEPPLGNDDVQHVVFVIHGIRDRGYWTRRIALHIKQQAHKRGVLCRSVTSTYGYFPMGPFLVPWNRRNHVEWLLDKYVTAKSLYPKAQFAYVGHSNGTYLLAKALDICPAVHFCRVVLAGSVLPGGYNWQRFLKRGQLQDIVNYVASADWVVAIFPHGLERLRLQDLGGAGHTGFGAKTIVPTNPVSGKPPRNVKFVTGGHGAALAASYWDDIAEFVLDGVRPKEVVPKTRQNGIVRVLGFLSPLIWFVIAVVVIGIGWAILAPLGLPFPNALIQLGNPLGLSGLVREEGIRALFQLVPWNWAGTTPGWFLAFIFAGYLRLLSIIATKA